MTNQKKSGEDKDPDTRDSVSDLCRKFEYSWPDSGSVEEFLEPLELPHLELEELIVRLIRSEIELRRREGDLVSLDYYLDRFPGLSPEVLNNLFLMPPPPRSKQWSRVRKSPDGKQM